MKFTSTSSPDNIHVIRVAQTGAALLIALWTAVFSLLETGQPDQGAHSVFVWADIAAVSLAGALPAAAVLSDVVMRKRSRTTCVVVALSGFGLLICTVLLPFPVADGVRSSTGGLVLIRTGLALLVAGAACLAGRVLIADGETAQVRTPAILLGLAVTCGLIAPVAYTQARCRRHQKRVEELLGQYRLGQAERLAIQLERALPGTTVNGRPLGETLPVLQAELSQIRAAVESGLPEAASPPDRIEYARLLAILGRSTKAVDALGRLSLDSQVSADDCNTIATVYETCEQWQRSLDWYQSAAGRLQEKSGDPATQQTRQVIALRGIAYCQRKLGRLHEAGVAYEAALRLSPTADMHFLLAQFYEDNQYASKARFHARRAILLDPFRFETSGQEMIDRLVSSHFGCLSVYSDERNAAADTR